MGFHGYPRWRPYVSVAQRRRQADAQATKLQRSGRELHPVRITGRQIATTFWGEAWCRNLEAYSDYANRLPRGRTYVRNGSVFDLRIDAGHIHALVSGSEIYKVEIAIQPLAQRRWALIKAACGGGIGSLIELLQGSLSRGVMEVVTRKGEGLFPAPREISLKCSCPDWAVMCKHVAAVLYGVGARLDHEPAMLFALRGVDPTEMVTAAAAEAARGRKPARGRVLAAEEVASVFGIELDDERAKPARRPRKKAAPAAGPRKKAAPAAGPRKKAAPAAGPRKKAGPAKPAATKAPARKKSARRDDSLPDW